MLDTRRREFIALIGGGCLLLAVKGAWGQQPAPGRQHPDSIQKDSGPPQGPGGASAAS
jgi:hypothetical protein